MTRLRTTIFLVHVAATLAMTGIIWFIQIVHYPLLSLVDPATFPAYEAAHVRLAVWTVMPFMATELGTGGLLLWCRPSGISKAQAWSGLALLGLIWGSTVWLQVPQHHLLRAGFNAAAHQLLVTSNWIRTVAWSVRSLLALRMVWGVMR